MHGYVEDLDMNEKLSLYKRGGGGGIILNTVELGKIV